MIYLISIAIAATGFLILLKIYNKEIDKRADSIEPGENYLNAKEIFVRDPEAFKDKDRDGIDDIIDKEIK